MDHEDEATPYRGVGMSWKEQSHRPALEFLLLHSDLGEKQIHDLVQATVTGFQKSQLKPILIIVERRGINPNLSGSPTDPDSTR